MKRHIRPTVAVVLGLGLVGLGAGGALRTARADDAAPGLSTYSLVGVTDGVVVYEDEPSANAHPEGQASTLEASSFLGNGPSGRSRAAVGWPGATEGNAGDLVILLFPGPLSQVTQVPDAVTAAVDSNAKLANYPMRAEATLGSVPDAIYAAPPVNLAAHAVASKVDASADLTGAQQPGLATYGNMHAESTSSLNGNAGRVVATTTSTKLDFGGVVKIGSITTTAIAQTNGVKSFGSGSTVVSGMSIGGEPAYVDDTGIHIGQQGVPANAAANQIAQQALSQSGMQLTVSAPQLVTKGATTTYSSGSIVLTWVVPQDPSHNVFVYSIGGSRVAVAAAPAAPGIALPLIPGTIVNTGATPGSTPAASVSRSGSGGLAGSGGASAIYPGGGAGSASGGSLSANGAASAVGPSSVGAPRGGGGGGGAAGTPLRLITAKTFGGISLAWVLIGLLGVGVVFGGSRRLALDVLDRPRGICPLESTGS